MHTNRKFKIEILLILVLLISTTKCHGAEEVERPCQKADLVGIWILSESKNRGNVPTDYNDLIQPYQVRSYKNDNSFSQLTSNSKLSKFQISNLLSIPQNQTFKLIDGNISTYSSDGNLLEQCSCSYFFRDFPKGKIKKGTLSLLWLQKGQPLILNTYLKIDLNR